MQAKHYILLALIVIVPLALFVYSAIKEAQKTAPAENQQQIEEKNTPSE